MLVAPLLLLTCDCGKGPIGGATTGFIPVPEGSEGTIHQWGIEGAQPEDKVRIRVSNIYLNYIEGSSVYIQIGKGVWGIKIRGSLALKDHWESVLK